MGFITKEPPPRIDSGPVERAYALETPAFRYLRLSVEVDKATGGQTVIHELEVHGPQRQPYMLFTHFRPEGDPDGMRNISKTSTDTPDSRQWNAGERLVLRQAFRLPTGLYSVHVGLVTRSRQRLPLGGRGDMVSLGTVEIETPPTPVLQRSVPLVPASLPTLLQEILALKPLQGDQRDNLLHCYSQAPQFGHVLEFGVATGKSISYLGNLSPYRQLWGFDTFEGLPEEWVRSDSRTVAAGTFTQGGKLPPVPDNVSLVRGLIQDTLPGWLADHPGNIAFLHVDVDIYSAAKFVLERVDHRLVPGSVIVFDDVAIWRSLEHGESGGYDKWKEGEWRALNEWAAECKRQFTVVSRLDASVLGLRVLA